MAQATADLRRRVRLTAHRAGLPALWRWWVDQLAPLVPAGLRTAAQRRRVRPVLVFGREAVVLEVPRIADGTLGFVETARIALAGDPGAVANAGRAAIDSLTRVAYGGAVAPAKVAVAIPREQVLRKALTLPAVVEDNLRQTIAYDLDRHTPFKADEVYFDAVVVARDRARKEIRVDWAAALKSVVDQARRRAEAWGATVVAVWPEMPDRAEPFAVPRLNLLPVAERPEAPGWRRWQIVVPAMLLLALAVAATALPLWQKRTHTLTLMQLVEQAHLQANASDALRQQLDQLVGDYNFALQRKYSFPAAVQVLDDVTRILPDDTWLTQLEVRTPPKGKEARRDILLRGESANAGRLVSLLEESKLVEQAAPRSPMTKIQPGPGEIFDLGAQLKPLVVPGTVQLSSLPRLTVPAEAAIVSPTPPTAAGGKSTAPAAVTGGAATGAAGAGGAAVGAGAAARATPRPTPTDAVQAEGEASMETAVDPRAAGVPPASLAGNGAAVPGTSPEAGSSPAAPTVGGTPAAPTQPEAVAPPPAAPPATASQPERRPRERGLRGSRAPIQ